MIQSVLDFFHFDLVRRCCKCKSTSKILNFTKIQHLKMVCIHSVKHVENNFLMETERGTKIDI